MPHKTNIIIPLMALILVTLAPPGTSVSCAWEEPVTMAQVESPVWFLTLLDILHAGKPAAKSGQKLARDTTGSDRSPALPATRIPAISD
jgi:hypothetical protein